MYIGMPQALFLYFLFFSFFHRFFFNRHRRPFFFFGYAQQEGCVYAAFFLNIR